MGGVATLTGAQQRPLGPGGSDRRAGVLRQSKTSESSWLTGHPAGRPTSCRAELDGADAMCGHHWSHLLLSCMSCSRSGSDLDTDWPRACRCCWMLGLALATTHWLRQPEGTSPLQLNCPPYRQRPSRLAFGTTALVGPLHSTRHAPQSLSRHNTSAPRKGISQALTPSGHSRTGLIRNKRNNVMRKP